MTPCPLRAPPSGGSKTGLPAAGWSCDRACASLDNLGIERLPLCMFHDTADVACIEELLELVEEGLIGHIAANVDIAARGPLPPELVDRIDLAVPDLPDTLLNPYYWPGAVR